MTQQLERYRYGRNQNDAWDGVPTAGMFGGPPSAQEVSELLSNRRPFAIVRSDCVAPADLAAAESAGGDCVVVVADPVATTSGRGSADLASVFWQTRPNVAAMLGGSLLDIGAVVLPSSGLEKLRPERLSENDPVTSAVVEIVAAGGQIKTLLVPGRSDAALPSNPPKLVPDRPSSRNRWIADSIRSMDAACLPGQDSSVDAVAVRAGLLLWHDFLDESHELSQSIEGQGTHRTGDYWHAIMHRREPDYGNAKYWFRRVGTHPVFESLAARGERLAGRADHPLLERLTPGGKWDPHAFIDACAAAETSHDAEQTLLLRRFQADEMLLLLWQACQDAGD